MRPTWDIVNGIIPFLAGFLLSFIGSMPPGMINLTVAKAAIDKGLRRALWIGLGAALVESLQAWLALQFAATLRAWEGWQVWFQVLAVIVLGGIGLFYLLSKPRRPIARAIHPRQNLRDFGLGLWISSLNLLAFPYWVFYGTYLQGQHLLHMVPRELVAMSLGVGLGTFLLLWLYARGGQVLVNRLPAVMHWTHRAVGAVMIGLGMWQAVLVGSQFVVPS